MGGTVREDGLVIGFDLGINLSNGGNTTELSTTNGQEINTIINDANSVDAGNTVFIIGITGIYHTFIVTHDIENNTVSFFDQGSGWDLKCVSPQMYKAK